MIGLVQFAIFGLQECIRGFFRRRRRGRIDEVALGVIRAEELKKTIPRGPYCYTFVERVDNGYMAQLCPYWRSTSGNDGRCDLLKVSDFILLWDQVKICGINEEDGDEDRARGASL